MAGISIQRGLDILEYAIKENERARVVFDEAMKNFDATNQQVVEARKLLWEAIGVDAPEQANWQVVTPASD